MLGDSSQQRSVVVGAIIFGIFLFAVGSRLVGRFDTAPLSAVPDFGSGDTSDASDLLSPSIRSHSEEVHARGEQESTATSDENNPLSQPAPCATEEASIVELKAQLSRLEKTLSWLTEQNKQLRDKENEHDCPVCPAPEPCPIVDSSAAKENAAPENSADATRNTLSTAGQPSADAILAKVQDGFELELDCGDEEVIIIDAAMHGMLKPGVPHKDAWKRESFSCANNISDTIREQCHNRHSCGWLMSPQVIIPNGYPDTLIDPCPGNAKTAFIFYRCTAPVNGTACVPTCKGMCDMPVAHPTPPKQPHVILAAATGYATHHHCMFFSSLRNTGFAGTVVLGVGKEEIEKFEARDGEGAEVRRVYSSGPFDVVLLPFEAKFVNNDVHGPDAPHTKRFRFYEEAINMKRFDGGMFLLTDFRDVSFQRNPFTPIPPYMPMPAAEGKPGPEILFHAEHAGFTLDTHGVNNGWMLDCWSGDKQKAQWQGKPIINSGSIIGTRKGLSTYIPLLLQEMDRCPRSTDQPLTNWVVWSGTLAKALGGEDKYEVVPLGKGSIAVVGIWSELAGGGSDGMPLDCDHYYLNDDGSRTPVIHQYQMSDRMLRRHGRMYNVDCPMAWNMTKQKLRNPCKCEK